LSNPQVLPFCPPEHIEEFSVSTESDFKNWEFPFVKSPKISNIRSYSSAENYIHQQTGTSIFLNMMTALL